MKSILTREKIKKLIIVLFVITTLGNFIPKTTYAKTDTNGGGVILAPISTFTTFVCDKLMNWLQTSFVTTETIKPGDGSSGYNFQYSPAIIFSGNVPALSINFINPPDPAKDTKTTTSETVVEEKSISSHVAAQTEEFKSTTAESVATKYYYTKENETYRQVQNTPFYKATLEWKTDKNERYKCEFIISSTEQIQTKSWKITKLETISASGKEYESTAGVLQSTIATWYKVLRRIALVGLLSALLYIGIRIVMSSASPQSKSKYKGMLKDWLVALCLLFTLHYIMSFTIAIVQEISKIFNTGNTDTLLNTLRQKIADQPWDKVAAEVLMYAILVVFTIRFTITYIRRVIYMAFFTMIAPLICLTYPLDKIKDGQAQAFNMWIKEYVFNALIQIVHLLMYNVLVSSAITLVDTYALYAIIVLSFMKPAEGIIRKMFGFDTNASTLGAVGGAATGSLVMSYINKLKKPPKKPGGAPGKEEGSKPIRTATNKDPLAALKGGNGASGNAEATVAATMTSHGKTGAQKNSNKEKIKKEWLNDETKKKISGATSILKKYGGKSLDKTLKLGLGGTGAMLGLAAGITQGDVSAALTGATAGAAAGQGVARGIENRARSIKNVRRNAGNIRETFESGYLGSADAARNARFDREFKRSSDYETLSKNGNFSEDKIDAMLDAGITDKSTMEKLLNNGGDNIEEAIGYYTLAQKCDDSIYYDDDKLQTYIEDLGIDSEDATEIRKKMRAYR